MNYYNEWDKKTAAWLRELIKQGLISDGIVDERSICDVQPEDLRGFTQCHFFAGIGGWSYALRLAGWPDDRPVWTASLPCQPFSAAGKQQGAGDDRHLWPHFFGIVRECLPYTMFGEQVAKAIGFDWLDGVSADLEEEAYSVGACVLGAHSAGAPHQRQRLYWVAKSEGERFPIRHPQLHGDSRETESHGSETYVRLADSRCPSDERRGENRDISSETETSEGEASEREWGGDAYRDCSPVDTMGNSDQGRRKVPNQQLGHGAEAQGQREAIESRIRRSWSDSSPILCRDGKYRRVPTEPSLFPLADGLSFRLGGRRSGRSGLLRGSGNAIVPQVAAQFIQAFLESIE